MIGSTLGNYCVEAVVGEGGMGTVYRAEHLLIGKQVAIKILRQDLSAGDEMVQRFFNEARAAARAKHPGIIDVYDFGRHDGCAYLVMELLDGEPLSARLRRERLDHDTVRLIGRQVASALAAAHDAGIAHRDLKPDNIFLARDETAVGGVRVKLLDFGIAKLTEADGSSSAGTRTGAIMGTPAYMSPEQCRGAGDVDHRADLYALGCILFEMMAGRPPFIGHGTGELISAHLTRRPQPMAAAAPGVPAPLAGLVDRLLAKQPGARLQHARDVASVLGGTLDLAAAESGQTVGVAPADHRTRTTISRHPHAGQSTLSAAAAAQDDVATQVGSPARRWLAMGAAALLLVGAGVTVGVRHGSGPGAAGRMTFDAGAPALRQPLVGMRQLDAIHRASGSAIRLYADADGWESARADFANAAAQPGAPARWTTAATLCDGMAKLADGDAADALVSMRAAADAEPDWVMTQLALSVALSQTGAHDEAIAAAHRAEELAPDWWVPVAAIGNADRKADNFERAVESYQRALLLAPKEPVLIADLALMYHVMHLDEQALDEARRALALDPDMVGVRIILSERALERGDGSEALAEAEQLLAEQPTSAAARLAQADALALLGRKDEARATYQRALDLTAQLEQDGAPPQRLKEVARALAAGTLPPPRSREHRVSRRERSKHAHLVLDRTIYLSDDPLRGLDGL